MWVFLYVCFGGGLGGWAGGGGGRERKRRGRLDD